MHIKYATPCRDETPLLLKVQTVLLQARKGFIDAFNDVG